MNNETLNKIIGIIAEQLKQNETSITADTKIKDDMHADSLDVAQILFTIEDEYEIEIPTEQAVALETVGQVSELVDSLIAEKK